MNLTQHKQAGELLTEIQDKLTQLRQILPNRDLKDRCYSVQKHLQNRLINRLRFNDWETAKNPDGSYAFSLHDSPYPAIYFT